MNKFFKVIWSNSLQCFVVTSELSRSSGKEKTMSSSQVVKEPSGISGFKLAPSILAILISLAPFTVLADGIVIGQEDMEPAEIGEGFNMAHINTGTEGIYYLNVYEDESQIEVINGGITINAKSPYPAVVVSAGQIDLGDGSFINSEADGVFVSGNGAVINSSNTGTLKANNLSITSTGVPSDVIKAEDNSKVQLAGVTDIEFGITKQNASSSSSYISGVSVGGEATLDADDINITYSDASDSDVVGVNTVTGIHLAGGQTNINGDTAVNMSSTSAAAMTGIEVDGDGDVDFSGATTVSLVSNSAENIIGIALNGASASELIFNDVTVNAQNNKPSAGDVHGFQGMGFDSDLSFDNLNVTVSGQNNVHGVTLGGGPDSKVRGNNVSINMSGGEEANLYGFYGSDDADIVINDLNIQSEGGYNVYLLASKAGNQQIFGNVTLGSLTSYQSVKGTLYSIHGSSTLHGNRLTAYGEMYAPTGEIISISTADNSYIYGNTDIQKTVVNQNSNGVIDLSLNGNNSRWDMTEDSVLTNLTLNNSMLDFHANDPSGNSVNRDASEFHTLTVEGDYHGDNGNIIMNSALGGDNSATDRLIIEGSTSGSTNVSVNNAGGTGAQTLNGIELISVGGQSDGEFNQKGRIVAGAYDYSLARGQGSNSANWYLTSTASPVDPITPTDPLDPATPIGPVDPGTPTNPSAPAQIIRPEAAVYGANLAAANTLFNMTLHDRLGETHYVDAFTGQEHVTSLWLRQVGGHNRSHDSSGQNKTLANRYVAQLGGDIAQWSSDGADRFHVGVMGGYANQSSHTRNHINGYKADGSVEGYSAGLYGTWFQDNEAKTGAYVDSWALYNWFDNEVSGQDIASESYESKGVTASVETGYTWKLGERNERESYYIQPQAQLTWMGVTSDDHREANGTNVRAEGENNIQTRLGVRAFIKGHSKMDEGKERTFEPFVEANWIHNTEEFGASLDGVSLYQDGTRDIGELKVGVEAKLSKNTNLWGNVAQQVGGEGYSDTQATVGFKMSF